jgi:hypothetical protein
MSRFRNVKTGTIVSVDDSKDARFKTGWKRLGDAADKPADTGPEQQQPTRRSRIDDLR